MNRKAKSYILIFTIVTLYNFTWFVNGPLLGNLTFLTYSSIAELKISKYGIKEVENHVNIRLYSQYANSNEKFAIIMPGSILDNATFLIHNPNLSDLNWEATIKKQFENAGTIIHLSKLKENWYVVTTT